MTLSNVAAQWGLSGSGTPTRTNISSSVGIGESGRKVFTDADILYSFKATAVGTGDVATLTVSSGAVAQTAGTPTITDGGVDFEGKAIPTMVTLYGIWVTSTVVSDTITVGGTNVHLAGELHTVGGSMSNVLVTGNGGLGTVTFTLDDIGDEIECIICGRTT